jgi:hypothetical protein
MSRPEDELDHIKDKLFASSGSTCADRFRIKRGPLLPDYTDFATLLSPVTMPATQDADVQECSFFTGDDSLGNSHARTKSGLSNDSDYTSTMADDSWNQVHDFVATFSLDEEPDLTHAVSLFDMKSAHATPQHSTGKVYKNSEEMTKSKVRLVYLLNGHKMAGL